MTPNRYQELAGRTQCSMDTALERIVDKCSSSKWNLSIENTLPIELIHSVIGLTGEVGELAATLERCYYYGQSLDTVNLKEELGDCLWYVAEMCNALNLSLEDVMECNIAKLKKRYPEKFDQELAKEENRNRDAERSAVQKRGGPFDVESLKRHGYTQECAEFFQRQCPKCDNKGLSTVGDDCFCSKCGWYGQKHCAPLIPVASSIGIDVASGLPTLSYQTGQGWAETQLEVNGGPLCSAKLEIVNGEKCWIGAGGAGGPSEYTWSSGGRIGNGKPPTDHTLAKVAGLDLIPPATKISEEDIALTESFGDGVVRQKKLDNSYNRFCIQCHKTPVHHSGYGICPDCAADIRAGRIIDWWQEARPTTPVVLDDNAQPQ